MKRDTIDQLHRSYSTSNQKQKSQKMNDSLANRPQKGDNPNGRPGEDFPGKGDRSLAASERRFEKQIRSGNTLRTLKRILETNQNVIQYPTTESLTTIDTLGKALSALSNGTRIRILWHLLESKTYGQITRNLGLNANTAAFHLKKLGEFGFINKVEDRYRTTDLGSLALELIGFFLTALESKDLRL